jgi:hypothetical protein
MAGSKILTVTVDSVDHKVSISTLVLDEHGGVVDQPQPVTQPMFSLSGESLTRRTIQLLTDLLARSRPSPHFDHERYRHYLEVLGEHLYDLIFQGRARERLDKELESLRSGHLDLLRVDLEFPPSEASGWLSSLPWEYLRTPRQDDRPPPEFLASTGHVVLNRRLSVGEGRQLPVRGALKVLLVCPSPGPDGTLPEVTCERVRDAIEGLGRRRMTLDQLVEEPPPKDRKDPDWRSQATREAFKDKVRAFKPNVIHFVGHGRRNQGRGELAFLEPSGEIDWVEEGEIARWVAVADELKLVFLQACESALPDPYQAVSGLAQRIASVGIPAVVAMQHQIEVEIANIFAEGFYQGLASGQPIDLAVGSGREKVRDMQRESAQFDFGLPVLYLRGYQAMMVVEPPVTRPTAGLGTPQSRVACPRCQERIDREDNFCSVCRLKLVCSGCNKRFKDPQAPYCPGCGEEIHQAPWSPTRSPSEPIDVRGRPSGGMRVVG